MDPNPFLIRKVSIERQRIRIPLLNDEVMGTGFEPENSENSENLKCNETN